MNALMSLKAFLYRSHSNNLALYLIRSNLHTSKSVQLTAPSSNQAKIGFIRYSVYASLFDKLRSMYSQMRPILTLFFINEIQEL